MSTARRFQRMMNLLVPTFFCCFHDAFCFSFQKLATCWQHRKFAENRLTQLSQGIPHFTPASARFPALDTGSMRLPRVLIGFCAIGNCCDWPKWILVLRNEAEMFSLQARTIQEGALWIRFQHSREILSQQTICFHLNKTCSKSLGDKFQAIVVRNIDYAVPVSDICSETSFNAKSNWRCSGTIRKFTSFHWFKTQQYQIVLLSTEVQVIKIKQRTSC